MKTLEDWPNDEPTAADRLEEDRIRQGARHLKERLSRTPYYAKLAARPDSDRIFEQLYSSCVKAPFRKP